MKINATVLKEVSQTRNGIEYVQIVCLESGPEPLLQMFDYSLREDEKIHKGKLEGKQVVLQVDTIRAIFAGRAQMSGRMALGK